MSVKPWNWSADDSTSNADKAWNAVIVGAATAGISYFLPLPGSEFFVNPLGLTSGYAINKYLFMGLMGGASSLVADFAHDMILHNLNLPADFEKNSQYLLRGVLGGLSGGAALYITNPALFDALPKYVGPLVGAIGEISGSWIANKLNDKSMK